ncbi:hypothetical protein [Cupriavidus sp. TMH.W2]
MTTAYLDTNVICEVRNNEHPSELPFIRKLLGAQGGALTLVTSVLQG